MAGRPAGSTGRRRTALVAAALALVVTAAGIIVGTNGPPSDAVAGATNPPATTPSTASTGGRPIDPVSSHPVDPTHPAQSGGGTAQPAGGTVLPAGFALRAGTAGHGAATDTPVIAGQPLPDTLVARILQRLPNWATTPDPGTDFNWPTQSLTKPAAGTTITQTFPADSDSQNPPTAPVPPPAGPLKVVRMQPQGSVSVAPFVSITFNQPMVAVSTVGQLSDAQVPARISPAIPGHWDWIGTTTLRFSADSATVDRLPMATRFTVTVPAGTKSTGGGVLATAATVAFDTPPPLVATFTPEATSPTGLQPVMVAVFNQRVDAATVLGSVTVTADGRSWPVRAATAAEIAADPVAAATVSAAPDGRAVTFIPTRDFPADSPIQVRFKAGTRSAEGPLVSGSDADFRFWTHPGLALVTGSCINSGCEPGAQIELTFSTPIDTHDFDPSSVSVSPALPGGASISAVGDVVVVSGATQPATTYRITVRAGLTDTFGQTLAKDAATTVTIGHADTRIYPFPNPVTTLDPTVPSKTVTITTVNQKRFRERVFAVDLADWAAYRAWYVSLMQLETYQAGADLHAPAWPVLVDRTVTVPGPGDQVEATALDLGRELTGGPQQAVLLIEPIDPVSPQANWQNRPTITWVQSTALSVDAFADQTSLHTWVTDLRTNAPVPGVSIDLLDGNGNHVQSGIVTDATGLAATDLTGVGAAVLLATLGNDHALLPSDMWGDGWKVDRQTDQLLWYVTDDRQTYRPGETVSVKGWVRRQSGDTAMALTTPGAGTVSWSATDGYGTEIGHGTTSTDRLGGFDLTLTIPAGAHLGNADLHLALQGVSGLDYAEDDHQFLIADYRTPAFDVQTHATTADPAVRGTDLSIQTDATYYAGGALGKAPVAWQVRTATATYTPPGWSTFTFGVWTPWWYDTAASGSGVSPCCVQPPPDDVSDGSVRTFNGTTDGNGSDYLSVNVGDLGKDTDGLPVAVLAQATVTDVNRQQIAGTADVLVHPANYYVGLASDATFVKQGDALTLRAIVTGIDGTAKSGRPVTVTAARVIGDGGATPLGEDGRSGQVVTDPQTCTVTSATTPVECTFTPKVGGEYRITATVADEQGRSSRTQLTRWVAGADGSVDTGVQEQSLTLIPDRAEYRPGQSAQLLVASPIAEGTGLLTVTHNGVVSTNTFTLSDGSAVVPIPITEASIPGVGVSIEVVGTVPRSTDSGGGTGSRPAYATGEIDLAVSTSSRSLTVTARPRASTVKPGGHTTIDVAVTDAAGKPVADSQFEVIVVDEAVLALSGYRLADPLDTFYPKVDQSWLWPVYGRSMVMLGQQPSADGAGGRDSAAASSAAASGSAAGTADQADTGSMAVPAAAAPPTKGAGSGSTGTSSTTPIEARTAFAALALFQPGVTTDVHGRASVPLTLPDNLTRYRIMVVAVAGDTRFGTGESSITAGLPLTVRPTPPRFLNFGDRASLPVMVQNLTDAPLTTDVVLQGANLTVADDGSGPTAGATGKQVTVPANGRVEVRFAVAADRAGTARFRVVAVSGDDADAAEQEIPVYTPSTSETFATYGTVTGGSVLSQHLTRPAGVIPAFGGLQVSTSSTALAQLTDAVDYVVDYDYSSSDALACQIIAVSSLGDVLQAFSVPGLPSSSALKTLVGSDIRELVALQNSDGGFPYWRKGEDSDPFNSIQAVQALLIADGFGYAGSAHDRVAEAVTNALPYLHDIDAVLPAGTSEATRDTMNAYALAVRSLARESSATSAADAMVADRGDALPLDAVAWLLPVVSSDHRQTLLTRVGNAAVDDAGSVTFTQSVTDDSWTVLASDTRTDALVLDALLTVDPTSDLIPKVVGGLMAQQRGGRWETVQDNAFSLATLRRYYDAYESATPDFLAGVWLGDRLAGQHRYTGHTTEQTSVTIPTATLAQQDATSVTLADDGTGRMYYRIALTTAPASLSVAALDRGFVVDRSYAGADDPSDVTRDAKGVWHIKAGARVTVTVTMVSRSAQSHVVLTDPLPAGLEPLNPALATTSKDLAAKNADGGDPDPFSWNPTWYDHQDLRDDRAEAFAGWLQGGVYTYSYLATATTPGTFVVPPATAQQVYAPETFGRSATGHVVVGG